MKTPNDIIDRAYNIMIEAGFHNQITGEVIKDPAQTISGECLLITGIIADHGYGAVDVSEITFNLLIPDKQGTTDYQRFRFLAKQLNNILNNHKSYDSDFVQYERNNQGAEQTSDVIPADEYFHIIKRTTTGYTHDPERQGYSYYSVRTTCWIEK